MPDENTIPAATVDQWRKKPVVVEARQWDGSPAAATALIDWMLANGATARYHDALPDLAIDTLEGTMSAVPGDWIIKGVQGEFYPCKSDIFAATYEPACLAEPEPAEPALPDGTYGRIEIPGYRENTGWVTAETRFGVPMAVVRDRSGRVTAEVSIGPGCRFVHLPVPGQAQPAPSPLALPAADGDDGESAGITATEPDPWTEAAPF